MQIVKIVLKSSLIISENYRTKCYICDCFSALKHRFWLHREEEEFCDEDQSQVHMFENELLDKSLNNMMTDWERCHLLPLIFEANLPSGFVYSIHNIWDLDLSTPVFHFLSLLSMVDWLATIYGCFSNFKILEKMLIHFQKSHHITVTTKDCCCGNLGSTICWEMFIW